jgi:hypothetical protein
MSELAELRASLEARTTEELISILRNRNADEWRPEVFDLTASILVARGVSPATVSAMGPEGEDLVEQRPLATVARYFSPAEAHSGRMALEAAELQAWVVDQSLGTVYGVGVGTRLQVRAEDEEAARAILEGEAPATEELPAELGEPPCPQCGSANIALSSEAIEGPDVHRARGGRRQRDWYYECRACGHRWRDDSK